MAAPGLTFSYDKAILSDETGHNCLSVTFSSDSAYTTFECRATKAGAAYGRGIGVLVASFSATPANTARTFELYDEHLVAGDGAYRISLYAQGADGAWNDNAAFIPSQADRLMTYDGKDFLCMN